MGIVWAATCTESDQPVALKFMKAAEDQVTLRRRFLREARAACAIEHPNVVRILDVLDLPKAPVIVMERLHGESLAECLSKGGPMSPAQAAAVLLPVVSAVSSAHALGIVHRDLKPDNIFIDRTDGKTTVKVLDFGIAKLVGAQAAAAATAHATTTGALLGTPAYMSPEQVFGEKDIDHRADVWSLGMILYECLTGVLPTRADNVGQVIKLILTRDDWRLAEVAPDLPEDLVELVGKMLARNRERRPSLRDVGEVLERYADSKGVRIQSEPPPASLKRGLGFASTVRAPSESSPILIARDSLVPGRKRKKLLVAAAVLAGLSVGGWWAVRDTLPVTPAGDEPVAAEPAVPAVEPVAATESRSERHTLDRVEAREPSEKESTDAAAAAPEPVKRAQARVAPRAAAAPKPAPPAKQEDPEPAAPPPKPKGNTLQSAVVDKPPF